MTEMTEDECHAFSGEIGKLIIRMTGEPAEAVVVAVNTAALLCSFLGADANPEFKTTVMKQFSELYDEYSTKIEQKAQN